MSSGEYGSMPIRPSSTSRRIVRSERTTPRFYERHLGYGPAAVSMLFPPIDPNERFRERRAAARRRKRLRRSAVLCAFLLAIGVLGVGARFVGTTQTAQPVTDLSTLATPAASGPRTLPIELRGVHVT